MIVHVGCENLKSTCELVRLYRPSRTIVATGDETNSSRTIVATGDETSSSRTIVATGDDRCSFISLLKAQHAQENGAAAIGLMPTTFFKPATIGNGLNFKPCLSY